MTYTSQPQLFMWSCTIQNFSRSFLLPSSDAAAYTSGNGSYCSRQLLWDVTVTPAPIITVGTFLNQTDCNVWLSDRKKLNGKRIQLWRRQDKCSLKWWRSNCTVKDSSLSGLLWDTFWLVGVYHNTILVLFSSGVCHSYQTVSFYTFNTFSTFISIPKNQLWFYNDWTLPDMCDTDMPWKFQNNGTS